MSIYECRTCDHVLDVDEAADWLASNHRCCPMCGHAGNIQERDELRPAVNLHERALAALEELLGYVVSDYEIACGDIPGHAGEVVAEARAILKEAGR